MKVSCFVQRLSPYTDSAPLQRNPAAGKRRRGAAVVEFAVVAPLLFLLILGLIEFGRMLMVQQILTNGAREGCRKAVLPGITTADVDSAIDNYMAGATISGHSKSYNPSNPGTAVQGTVVEVTVSVPYNQVSWLPVGNLQWLAGQTITSTVRMRKEANAN